MIFLKCFAFIVWNLLAGYLIVFTVKAIIFYPTKPVFYRNKKIPFTPGLAYRKKNWLIKKISGLLSNYLKDCESAELDTRVAKWENEVYKKAWDRLDQIERFKLLPAKFRENIRHFLSMIVYELVRQFLMIFVPYLLDKYKVENYIELVSQKLDVDTILGYFDKYIYRYMLYFSLSFFFLVGFGNMILFIIIH
ncbi:MAG: hypothetical protein H8E57_01170 [Candidatus Cloacimonetes bacterium]|nr:hypothetical protein [Candidatus Cloacimonadota bacterium]